MMCSARTSGYDVQRTQAAGPTAYPPDPCSRAATRPESGSRAKTMKTSLCRAPRRRAQARTYTLAL